MRNSKTWESSIISNNYRLYISWHDCYFGFRWQFVYSDSSQQSVTNTKCATLFSGQFMESVERRPTFCTEHDCITAVLCAKFENDLTIELGVMTERDLASFEFKWVSNRYLTLHQTYGAVPVETPPRISHGSITRYVNFVCPCAGNAGNGFPATAGFAIPTCITARAWRTCRDACRDR